MTENLPLPQDEETSRLAEGLSVSDGELCSKELLWNLISPFCREKEIVQK